LLYILNEVINKLVDTHKLINGKNHRVRVKRDG